MFAPGLMQDSARLAEQYRNDEHLRVRVETHEKYTVGPRLEPAVDAALNLAGSESLLDVGTGPGGFPGRLAAAGHRGRLVGMDMSSGMVERARADYPKIEFVVGDAQRLPFHDRSFDVVTARHMLYHVPDISLALREIHRVLCVGGRFLAVTNAAAYMQEYRDAIREAAQAAGGGIAGELGELMGTPISSAFNEVNGEEFIRQTFSNVHVQVYESALVFDEVAPVIRYFDSARTMNGVAEEQWGRISSALAKVVAKNLARGPWRISKRVALLSAQRGLFNAPSPRPAPARLV